MYRLRCVLQKTISRTLAMAGLTLVCGAVYAEPPDWKSFYLEDKAQRADHIAVDEDYALGLSRYDLDSHTEIIGWQLRNSLYFGRQDGLDSGLTLVWQQEANQVSLSKDGLRLTRRF